MKIFNNNKQFRPDEEIEDLYGPPEMLLGPEYAEQPYIPPVLRGTVGDKPSCKYYEKLLDCYKSIREKTDFQPKVALVLGSGLGEYAETEVDIAETIDYSEIKGFPRSTVLGHKGRFVFGYVGGVPVVVMQGRVHFYEGYDIHDVVLPTRLMSMLGAEILLLTNAAGGINTGFSAGDFMLIRDHISTFAPNPLTGKNLEELGTRFPDMSKVYDPVLCEAISTTAEEIGITLQQGVYLQLSGPSFETPAEIRMLRGFGADAVGMSTVVEAIAANHAGMRVCGISCISNLACGMTDTPLSHAEVQESADKAAPKFRALVSGAIEKFGSL